VTIAVTTAPNRPAMTSPSFSAGLPLRCLRPGPLSWGPVARLGLAATRGYPSGVPRIYTKTGDDGTTGLLYGGRVSKGAGIPDAVGTTDEAVAVLGLARALSGDQLLRERILDLQRQLFVVGADLATNPDERERLEPGVSLVTQEMVEALERRIDELVATHPLPNVFVVPGANPVSSTLDVARAVVRRAERRVVELRASGTPMSEPLPRYLNRLSDLLFILGRVANPAGDVLWQPGAAADPPEARRVHVARVEHSLGQRGPRARDVVVLRDHGPRVRQRRRDLLEPFGRLLGAASIGHRQRDRANRSRSRNRPNAESPMNHVPFLPRSSSARRW